jgi:hypothetical protein
MPYANFYLPYRDLLVAAGEQEGIRPFFAQRYPLARHFRTRTDFVSAAPARRSRLAARRKRIAREQRRCAGSDPRAVAPIGEQASTVNGGSASASSPVRVVHNDVWGMTQC